MSFRKFREFIQDRHRAASRGSELSALEEETYDSENYGCSDGYNWERAVRKRTEVVDE
jgi:hypothetical protein